MTALGIVTGNGSWEGISWGISPAQADKSFVVPHHPAEVFDAQIAPGVEEMKFDQYTTGNITFGKGYLEFQKGQLMARGMSLADVGNCAGLFETFNNTYGQPAYEDKHDDSKVFPNDVTYTHQSWWEDPVSNNRITVKNVRDRDYTTCDVMYEALKLPPGLHGDMELPPQMLRPQKLTPAAGGL
jgi:hypothetical protein